MTTILIADDHPIVRHGLRRLLDLQPDLEVGGDAADSAEVVQLLAHTQPEVIVLDLSLPHLGGLELGYHIRENHPQVKILVFSVQPEDTLSLYLLEAGVSATCAKITAWRRSSMPSEWSQPGDGISPARFKPSKPRPGPAPAARPTSDCPPESAKSSTASWPACRSMPSPASSRSPRPRPATTCPEPAASSGSRAMGRCWSTPPVPGSFSGSQS